MSQNSFYITTPIYYVNSIPHLGHAYTTIMCDIFKNYHQHLGEETHFLTGTDEHGDKIDKSAKEQGMTPQQLVDKNSQAFRDLLGPIDCKSDDFIRTTDERHKKVVQTILQKVYDKGDIYFDEYEGLYCLGCERYLGQDELVEGKCPDHQKVPEKISEKNYFFKMSKYWDQLKQHVEANPEFIKTENYRNEVLGLLKMEPQDLCISRPKERLTWGIELPFDKNFVTYVWFDALINYISALGYPEGDSFKKYWPSSHHMIAKDILKPHCVYWPTMLMSMECPLPKQIIIHGYWLVDESKMSKSIGNVVDPFKYCEKFGSDVFRYYLFRAMSFGKDASFSHEDFIAQYNADLANKVGNLYSRICGLLRKNNENKIPDLDIKQVTSPLPAAFEVLQRESAAAMKAWKPHEYANSIISFAESINKYLDETKPWSMLKKEEEKQQAFGVLKTALEGVRIIYCFLAPIMPKTTKTVLLELGIDPEDIPNQRKIFFALSNNAPLPEAPTGFPRLTSEE